MAESIKICKRNIDGFGSCDIAADGVCVQGPCHAEELVEYAPVVRCSDCKHWSDKIPYTGKKLGFHWCDKFCNNIVVGDDYCSYGELRDGGDPDGR